MQKFTKLIKCKHCGGNFKSKLEGRKNKKRVYLCTNYDLRNGKCDVRVAIPEQQLIDSIMKRYTLRGMEINENQIGDRVEWIVVEDKMLYEIKLKDFSDTINYGRTHINY